ncbi:MAG: 4Fe-4S dicluster domain-containing protein [Ruminococcaceae bacterium]|nr:4Fe-4S dicluster domain-containing protein [Oscillospiraceae bacterium]
MIYKNFKDLSLSALGLGCMRFPTVDGDSARIDMKKTEEIVAYAMKNGINYYDTAWGYHGGNSEPVIGEILSKYPRDSFYLSSKFPGYDLANHGKIEEIFEAQLKRCRVDYFDFYLIHSVTQVNIDRYLDPKYGTLEYVKKQKENGRIRHLGFSFHANADVMKRFLEVYGEYMEFGQLQLNWLDWSFQDAKSLVDILGQYGIPVWVMEPVRGGGLATLEPEYESRLRTLRPEASMAEWAFRFLQTVPTVTVTLSGMSNLEQLSENIKTFSESKPLNEEEWNTLMRIASEKSGKNTLACTSCRYCTEYCPKKLDIPYLISLYNEKSFTGWTIITRRAVAALNEETHPNACIGCGACTKVCPQSIDIPAMMRDFSEKMK